MAKNNEDAQKVRTKIRKFILRKYEEETAENGIEDPDKPKEMQQAIEEQEANETPGHDPLYNRVEMNLDRLLKMMTGHS